MSIIFLEQTEVPTHYTNIVPFLPKPLDPPLHPGTKKPLIPSDLEPIFPKALIAQEMSAEPLVEIPAIVRQAYMLYRPTPLVRAERLEKALGTKAKIYFKNESVSPVGSHKLNTALAQVYYNQQEGIKRIATETGAGQWGTALSFACQMFGLECVIYMVKTSFESKPYRKIMMNLFGGTCHPSPSDLTEFGRKVLAEHPDSTGSLGIAISEAIEDTVTHPNTRYALGSVLNHVLLHQTIIGQEAIKQLAKAGDYPDVIVGCHGGGSNFAGISFPFLIEKLQGKKSVRAIAVEPESCPTLTKGEYRYDAGDTAGMTPLLSMYTLGKEYMPDPIHAGGLRYHGASPIVSQLHHEGVIEARAYNQKEVFEAGVLFAKAEGIVPAPESCHAIKGAIDEALVAKESGEAKTILFCLSGHGHFDMVGYEKYLAGNI